MRVLVTGGAGYIGSHVVDELGRRGDYVVVVDDLSTGRPDRLDGGPNVEVDIADEAAVPLLANVLTSEAIDAVIHLAARKQVGESVERPAWYYRQNIGGHANLLLAMGQADVRRLVFSSSAAVYGDAGGTIGEDAPTRPSNPYGATKLAGEQLTAAAVAPQRLSAASLRYFNVGGAARPELADRGVSNLIPIVFEHLTSGTPPEIFGGDYPTPDGTCVRDYVHVVDVAEAHLAALDALDALDAPGHEVYNIGTGIGTSVLEMIGRISAVSGIEIPPVVRGRRAGDAASVVAEVDRIRDRTGWSARFGLDHIVASAWDGWRPAPGDH